MRLLSIFAMHPRSDVGKESPHVRLISLSNEDPFGLWSPQEYFSREIVVAGDGTCLLAKELFSLRSVLNL